LRKAIDAIIGDPARQAEMEQAMRSLARPNAAEEMADELLRLAKEPSR
jgi:UDP-N-acetylglucosamine:LPS N-acetylglucosamine transferase